MQCDDRKEWGMASGPSRHAFCLPFCCLCFPMLSTRRDSCSLPLGNLFSSTTISPAGEHSLGGKGGGSVLFSPPSSSSLSLLSSWLALTPPFSRSLFPHCHHQLIPRNHSSLFSLLSSPPSSSFLRPLSSLLCSLPTLHPISVFPFRGYLHFKLPPSSYTVERGQRSHFYPERQETRAEDRNHQVRSWP